MITIDDLNSFGANTEEGLARCMGKEALYLKLIPKAINDSNFEKLVESVEKGDMTASFEAAHALKGVMGNLSLTPLFDKSSEITELLRKKTDADYKSLTRELLEMRDKLKSLCD
ncbi:MAG: Hpt domain-containing protein [Lachnospiraceae bacterium]|nr:Hpt domain-containing protein [Lachnospiraceae bacterium]